MVEEKIVFSQYDLYNLYMQLSQCSSFNNIILLSKTWEQDIVGNTVSENMVMTEKRLEQLNKATIKDAET